MTTRTPSSKHHCSACSSLLYPSSWPRMRGMSLCFANLRLPSIMKATCRGIAPCRMTRKEICSSVERAGTEESLSPAVVFLKADWTLALGPAWCPSPVPLPPSSPSSRFAILPAATTEVNFMVFGQKWTGGCSSPAVTSTTPPPTFKHCNPFLRRSLAAAILDTCSIFRHLVIQIEDEGCKDGWA